MFAALARFSVRNVRLVVALTALFVAIALHAFRDLPIEAYPDVTDPMVEVVAVYPGQSAEEVERVVGLELERVLAGIPHLTNIRTVSVFGLAVVTLRFDDDSNDEDNRIRVAERLREAELPEGVEALVGPQSTPVGQIYRYTLHGPRSLRELRSIQDWVIERHLRSVPGVAEVVTFGGFEKQYAVRVDPIRLANMGVTVGEVYRALESGNRNAGGGYVAIGNQEFVVRSLGVVDRAADLGKAVVAFRDGVPIRVEDVADLFESSVPRRGSVGRGHEDEVVEGIVLLRRGENPERVLENLQARIDELNETILPKDVSIVPFYDRRDLTRHTLRTVGHNLLHGAILVASVTLLFLRSVPAALVVACVIPLSLLTAFLGLRALGMSANLISMGAIDFGILVENAAVVLEVSLHGLALHQATRREPLTPEIRRKAIADAALLVARPIGLASVIILLALVPLFLLERVEGRIFKPMAFTYLFALTGGLVAALTIVCALATVLLSKRVPHGEARWFLALQRAYVEALDRVRAKRRAAFGVAALLAMGAAFHARGIGSEFLPPLNEGGLYITAIFPPTIALDETSRYVPQIRRKILELPEAADVLSHLGRPEDAPQVEGSNNVEFFVKLVPMDRWRKGMRLGDLEEELRASLREIPGVAFNFSQPITDRVFETISGIVGQVVVKVRGEDLDALTTVAEKVRARLEGVEGIADLALYQAGSVPQLVIELDRERLAQRGLGVADVQEVIEIALGGKVATSIWEGERRYGVALRLPDHVRTDPEALGRLVVGDAEHRVSLSEVATIRPSFGRSAIWRENLSRFIAVKFNVRGRDLGSAVADARAAVADLELPEGISLIFGGEFENQQRAMKRLGILVPLVLVAMMGVLYWNFGRLRPALVIMAFLPLSAVFALAGLRLAGEHFSVSAAVGCITLLGQITLVGVLLCTRIDHAHRTGEKDPVVAGARVALRPVLLTVCLAALGLVPAALSHGMGSESQRPFAIAIICGLVATVPLVLLLLPLFYRPASVESKAVEASEGEPGRTARPVAAGLLVFVALSLVLPGSARAQEMVENRPVAGSAQGRFDVESLLAHWLAKSPEVEAWRSEVGAAHFDLVAARTLPNPELSLETGTTVAGEPSDDLTVFGASLTVPLPVLGQVQARTQTAKVALTTAEARLAVLLWERAAEIRKAAVQLAFAQGAVEEVETALGELARVQRIIEARSERDLVTRYDAMRVALVEESLQASASTARIERAQAEAELLALVGDPGLDNVALRPSDVSNLTVPRDENALWRHALDHRPDLELVRRSHDLALAQAEQARKEVVPVPSLFVGTEVARRANSVSLLGGLSIPLPVFDRNRGAIGRAEAEARAHELTRAALEARIRAEIRGALRALDEASRGRARSLELYERVTPDLLDRAFRAYEAGVFSVAEVLDALEGLWEARKALLETEKNLALARIELIRAAALRGE